MNRRTCSSALLIGSAALVAAVPAIAQSAPRTVLSVKIAAGPNMLGTRAVPIRADRFGDSLKRAREDASGSPILQRLIAPARLLPPLEKIAFVQRAVTSSIRWISDATEWGQHDYWASAAQTLAHGAGDAKNRAIVKLQALRALGFSNSDLFLTLARDSVGGPLTVLTVRSGGRYYVVDDSGAPPFPAEQRRFEFEPIMSFGMYGAWVHVRPSAPSIATASPVVRTTVASAKTASTATTGK
ncbi:MAG TPA: transglutaminase-like cysteine peptidase [Sphingomicrobium sp.]|nr:transglutaminase-like cysteine peptidase [Sphingomicrobium sp.]